MNAISPPRLIWPKLDDASFEKDDVALALVEAIESPMFAGATVVAATAVLLGTAGLDAQRAHRERIKGAGETPLVEQQDKSVTVPVTTVAAPMRVLH